MNSKQIYDLEDRLITFACECLDVCELLPGTKAGQNREYQLSKSSTASALIYGEAQAAESRSDFLHKMKICLKELRESYNALRILTRAKIHKSEAQALPLISECNELISIFVKSIVTASKAS